MSDNEPSTSGLVKATAAAAAAAAVIAGGGNELVNRDDGNKIYGGSNTLYVNYNNPQELTADMIGVFRSQEAGGISGHNKEVDKESLQMAGGAAAGVVLGGAVALLTRRRLKEQEQKDNAIIS